MNSNGQLTSAALTPYVKDAYLRWTYYGRQQMTLGIQPTATFEFIENFWGLRHIEKTPADLYRIDSSRDFGASFQGPVNDSQTVRYVAQFGNESGTNAETDPSKALRFATRYEKNPGVVVEGFYAFMKRPSSANRQIAQIFAGYQAPKVRAGFQYLYQQRQPVQTSTAPNTNLDVYSGFVVLSPRPQKWSVYVRLDRFADPNPGGSGIDYLPIDVRPKSTFALAGVEYYLFPTVRISPNIEWVGYSDAPAGTTIKDTVVARVTFYWVW
jgi:hypothetical protein